MQIDLLIVESFKLCRFLLLEICYMTGLLTCYTDRQTDGRTGAETPMMCLEVSFQVNVYMGIHIHVYFTILGLEHMGLWCVQRMAET